MLVNTSISFGSVERVHVYLGFVPLEVTENVQFLYLLVGVGLLIVGIIDLLWTILWTNGGAGPLTSPLMKGTWRGLKPLGDSNSRVLSLAGPIVISLTLAMWVLLIWAGWTLLFASDANALNYTRGPEPVSWVGRGYFVAYTMFTMGNGDFSPASPLWQTVTALTNASGMVLITLGVSYVTSVLRGVVNKQSFASSVMGVGETAESFVQTGWDGDDLQQHDLPVESFASSLSTLAAQHKAYPVLHYYRSERRQHAAPVAVAVFDDAVTILRDGIDADHRPNELILETAQSGVQDYIRTAMSPPADRTPPSVDLDRLRDAGISTVSDEEFDEKLSNRADQRRQLFGVVEEQEWQWPSEQQQ
ncbi:potassium channel family protein (plasmid) [Halorussus limi]|uniref:Potassium channel family protein n=1 Tax=Halorussus limi TaxID=2938695 RepID=A0A8U0I1D1_9EURY|nr:potassium channel family protein [Halorussus limi]UPV76701.1 potassium channel family protein [Halorussus limi]